MKVEKITTKSMISSQPWKKLTIIICTLALSGAFRSLGQTPAGAMAAIQKNFSQYTSNTLQEKLFVQTDKNAYTAGEILWFKVYDADAILIQPLGISKVAYVEVLNNNQEAVLQTKIALYQGKGSGSVYLPLSLPTGCFTLRAYTSWMKNFNAEYYFHKQLTIINPLKSPETGGKTEAPVYDVHFFPEGGNLVAGINSTVAFKANDQWGKGKSCSGAVLNQKNDTVAKFTSLKFGIGRFAFKPEANSSYHAILYIGGKTIQANFPTVNTGGYVMGLTENAGRLSITVNTTTADDEVYLFAQNRNVIKLIETAPVNHGTAQFALNKDKLGDGISQITVFNKARQPVCERLYFKRPAKSLVIGAAPGASRYGMRKKAEIIIDTKDQNANPVTADLSFSVYRLDSLQRDDHAGIQSYLWLSSDLRGNIEWPDYYFKTDVADAATAADNLMLTQGWRRFDWNDILTGRAPAFSFVPEVNGPVLTAKITDKTSGSAAKDIVAYLGVVGKSVQLYTDKSDADGRLLFNMKNFYGPAEIVVETNTQTDTMHHIDILTPFSDQFSKRPLRSFEVTPAMEPLFEEASLNMQVQNIYSSDKLRRFYDPHTDSSAFFGNVYNTYMLDLYTRFTTIEEIMREYVKEVNVTHLHNQFHLKVLNENGFLHQGDPLVLVDGVPFFNMNKVFAIDPLRLQKLQDVPYGYYLGPAFYDGIFSFTSYKGDFGGAEIDPHAVILDYEGLQRQRQFYSPDYESSRQSLARMPDARNVLYWSPSLITSVNGKASVSFYTSDLSGKYIVVIQGLTQTGLAGGQAFTFDVAADEAAQVSH